MSDEMTVTEASEIALEYREKWIAAQNERDAAREALRDLTDWLDVLPPSTLTHEENERADELLEAARAVLAENPKESDG